MSKLMINLLLLLLLAHSSFAADAEIDYSGVWRDKARPQGFYSIHDDGEKLVLIALEQIALTSEVLRYSYMGSKDNLVLTRVDPTPPFIGTFDHLTLRFSSADEAELFYICPVCLVVPITLEKIF